VCFHTAVWSAVLNGRLVLSSVPVWTVLPSSDSYAFSDSSLQLCYTLGHWGFVGGSLPYARLMALEATEEPSPTFPETCPMTLTRVSVALVLGESYYGV